MNILPKSNLIRKLRPNLYQLPHGQLVGFGPVEAENGLQWCYNCQEPECSHVEAITQAWLDGCSIERDTIQYNAIPFDGSSSDLPEYECRPCGKQVELTPADMYGDDPAVCDCGRFYTPVIDADDYAIPAVTL